MKHSFTIFFLLIFSILQAQTPIPDLGEIFRNNVVPRIDITIPINSLSSIYDLNNAYSDTEYSANFVFDNGTIRDTIPNIGFRLRGNTSRLSQKKSFKVSFNTFENGRKYYGLEKLNLNGEHNDPTIIRSILCWNLLRKMGIPAPRANHVEVYINGDYYGLYVNVEHIDEEFVDLRFGNTDGNLYKCYYGVDFNYISNNPNDYKMGNNGQRVYELKTNTTADDYSDLGEFIDILNNESLSFLPCELEKIFNVDAYLKVMAFDVLTANWDGPIWNKNNCYLYKNTATGKLEYIPFDVDNTYGVSWFGNIDWGTRNIYQWSQDGQSRPIYERILAIPEYRDRYSFYMNQIIQDFWSNQNTEIDAMKTLISPYVAADTYRNLDYGFTMQDFNNAFVQPIGMHLHYGIKDYILARKQSALSQLNLNGITPVLKDLKSIISIDDQILKVEIFILDNQNNLTVKGWFRENNGSFTTIDLFDDGNHNDGQANDNIFGGTYPITATSTTIEYYVSATDNENNTSRFPRCELINLNYNPQLQNLVINEFMASNEASYADNVGEFEDWIEIYNADENSVSLDNLYLSDNPNIPNKWQLPNLTLQPNEYLVIWADEDGSQGELHANFKLSKNGETIGIYSDEANGFAPLDFINYPAQNTDISYGRIPNGTGNFVFLDFISPNENNEDSAIIVIDTLPITEIILYPNPFTNTLTIFHNYNDVSILIYNTIGQTVFEAANITHNYTWNGINNRGSSLETGLYFITFFNENSDEKNIILRTERVIIVR
jgi:spore coat protein H